MTLLPKKYYAVTRGEYSDYGIVTITEDKEKADRIAAAYDGQVEEYEDSIVNPIGIWHTVYYEKEQHWYANYSEMEFEDVKNWSPDYGHSWLDDDTVWSIYVAAENIDAAKKIAQDKYAQWKAEREGVV